MRQVGELIHNYVPGVIVGLLFVLAALLSASDRKKRPTEKGCTVRLRGVDSDSNN